MAYFLRQKKKKKGLYLQMYDSFWGKKYIELFNHCYEQYYKRDFGKVFFDCANYYFEIDLPSEDKQKGPSKENRHGPIIGQALLLDADLVPLAIQMYPGNESEKPYIRKNPSIHPCFSSRLRTSLASFTIT